MKLNQIFNIFSFTNSRTDKFYANQQATINAIIAGGGGTYSEEMSNNINTVYTCKKILSETISKLPLNVNKDGKKHKEHYLYPLLHFAPNGYQTTQVFISTLVNHLMNTGNAYVQIFKKDGRVKHLQIIHPEQFTGAKISDNGYLYYTMHTGEIMSDNIIHLKLLSDDGIFGLSPLKALHRNLSINFQGMQTIDNYYKNGLHSSKYITSKDNTKQVEFNKGLADWQERGGGSLNSGKIFPVPYGTEIKELKLDFADAQILETVKYNTSQIAALYGIPAWMLGVGDMKYKSIEESLIAFQTQTIQPIAKIIKEELSHKLLYSQERMNEISIEFNLNAMLAADQLTRANYLQKMVDSGIMKLSKAAEIEGLDADEYLDFNKIQAQYQPIQAAYDPDKKTWKPVTSGINNNNNNNSNNE